MKKRQDTCQETEYCTEFASSSSGELAAQGPDMSSNTIQNDVRQTVEPTPSVRCQAVIFKYYGSYSISNLEDEGEWGNGADIPKQDEL